MNDLKMTQNKSTRKNSIEEFAAQLEKEPLPKKRKMVRERCRNNLLLFASYFFPEICRLEFSPLHLYLFKRRKSKIELPLDRRAGQLDVVVAPRGSAKSTVVSLILPIHAILYRHERYISLISATMRQASQRLINIRAALLDNSCLRDVWGHELKRVERRSARALEVNGVRIEAYSAGTELRGINIGAWRPTWIILDDVERGSRVREARHRDWLGDWFVEVVDHLGNGYTHIDVVGTLLHRDALPARLARRPDATARTFASIVSEAEASDLWAEWRARYHNLADPNHVKNAKRFFEERHEAMLAGAEVLWPEKEDYYDLQVIRETRGRAAFDKEKQNEPWSDEASLFDIDRLRRFRIEDGQLVCEAADLAPNDEATDVDVEAIAGGRPNVPLDELRLFGFLDPAMGGKRGDWAAIATVGVDAIGYIYVLAVWMAYAKPSEQIRRAFDLHERWGYEAFGIETNAFQRLLLDPFEQERKRRRERGRAWDMPIVERRHYGTKADRILKLEPLARNGWLFFNEDLGNGDQGKEFFNQLESFPNARHDDGPDAVAAAVDIARRAASPRLITTPRPRASKGKIGNY